MHNSKFIVSHIAARRDYDVATILYQNNQLDKLFIDAYYNEEHLKVFRFLDVILPKKIVNTYKRYQPSLPHEFIEYDWLLGLKYKLRLKLTNSQTNYKPVLEAYKHLAKNTLAYAKMKAQPHSYYGFDTSSKEFFEWAAPKGWFLILEQCIAPRASQINMLKQFQENYGIDQKINIEQCKMLQAREEKEWQLASIIIAPSEYVKVELLKAGAPEAKIRIVPFGYDLNKHSNFHTGILEKRFSEKSKKIRVLFAGNVVYRKGINEIISIAKDLHNENIEFILAGNIHEAIRKDIKLFNLKNVRILGKLSISALHQEYLKSDIFLFPSYLEGSAMVIFEAMSWGLPVVTTYQSGSVIESGKEGYLCHAGDTEKLKANLLSLVYNNKKRLLMSENARITVEKYSLKYYQDNLLEAINFKDKLATVVH
uniref:Glycosyltransferase family 4 protein n=1 Tax=Roseihalotalea indica TaxID=2867963 RepID=A0AA49GI71_9BACT|nr:glycosyltransferase family 4 protein [Tunicatimonas sp. TK19036]WKN34637.1 glycosyltransferase family 4 protein [Tunicatimonas sp. TK19036]